LRWLQQDALAVPPLTKEHLNSIVELSAKYADIPMDFAEATLIVISEIERIKEISVFG